MTLSAPPPAPASDPAAPALDPAAARRYRTVTRQALGRPEPARTDAGPLAAFVLTHPLAERTVAGLAAGHGPYSLLHLAQEIELHAPLRPGTALDAHAELLGARVETKGTRLALRTRLTGRGTGTALADLTTHVLLAGVNAVEPRGALRTAPAPRQETAGSTVSRPVAVDREWIARYGEAAGDLNPVHLDPAAAREAGFPDTVAHGMALVALAVEEIAERYADGHADRVRALGARFAHPAFPGPDTLLELTPPAAPPGPGDTVLFTVRSRGTTAVKGGWARLGPALGDHR
ncbi:MaoC/PaaZ C-terminal domain-containing protein [Streptomyces sp. NBC_01754]|uniref:MaoC/PaaZ C-terminal domain-containing protein n=1 Tax=Streptomyces sp. NBC_01754 TaxID=2975930 RepID=UPI002DD9F9CC|nr:MaoC/PaaZ C-terminal domain-containing protein [Streptomyces sp. NBC_01754]WSC95301.1 MaoC/PaaZ C-terminal domain-containing protein [Streptomyces sp. NBC_01754]